MYEARAFCQGQQRCKTVTFLHMRGLLEQIVMSWFDRLTARLTAPVAEACKRYSFGRVVS